MRPRLFGRLIMLFAVMTLAFTAMPDSARSAPAAPPPLVLTPAQQARAKARQNKFGQDMQALQANKTLTPAQKTAKAKAMSKTLDTDMLGILTPKQRAGVIAQRNKETAFKKAHQTEITQGQQIAARLNKSITAAQKQKIGEIQQQFMKTAEPRIKQIADNKSLSPQAKQQQIMAIEHEIDPKIKAVLTPTQRADFAKMQKLQIQLNTEAKAAQSKK